MSDSERKKKQKRTSLQPNLECGQPRLFTHASHFCSLRFEAAQVPASVSLSTASSRLARSTFASISAAPSSSHQTTSSLPECAIFRSPSSVSAENCLGKSETGGNKEQQQNKKITPNTNAMLLYTAPCVPAPLALLTPNTVCVLPFSFFGLWRLAGCPQSFANLSASAKAAERLLFWLHYLGALAQQVV